MRKNYVLMAVIVILFLITVSSLYLTREKEVLDADIAVTVTVDKIETIVESELPKFILKSVLFYDNNSRALIKVNEQEPQWFDVGNEVVGDYVIRSISDSIVTIFDGHGAYYEISLADASPEEE